MTVPRVYPILDTETLERRAIEVETAAAAFLSGGAQILQFRHKAHWSRAVFATAQRVAEMCRQAGARFVVNDRADFALLLQADLHVGQDDLPPADARRLLGPGAAIGYSSHNLDQLLAASAEPVDYVALGPIFPTASKLNPDPVTGLDQLRLGRTRIAQPLVAIGGITLENAAGVFSAGADSVAVIAGLLPASATEHTLRSRMEQWQQLATPV
jgi:thiamine-phosphate pyrophosphorylase